MKKLLAAFLSIAIFLSLAACQTTYDYSVDTEDTTAKGTATEGTTYITVTDKSGNPITTHVPVTDKKGKTKTDKKGEVVTTAKVITVVSRITTRRTTVTTPSSTRKVTSYDTTSTKKVTSKRTTKSTMSGGIAVRKITAKQLAAVAKATYITDIYTDKSFYAPGANATVTCELKNPQVSIFSGELELRLTKDGVPVASKSVLLSLSGNPFKAEITFTLPRTDLVGYAVEAYVFDRNDNLMDADMTAIDCSSDWRVYPRFGFVAGDMNTRSKEDSRAIIKELSRHHINTLYFQDMMDTHDTPLAGTVQNPASSYQTLSKATIRRQTLLDMLACAKEMNMKSFAYNLMFGAYSDCKSRGVDYEKWGLFQQKGGKGIDAHGPLPGSWESTWLLIMNPGNVNFQRFFAQKMDDFTTAYPFDGIIVDSLGRRGHTLYDCNSNVVDLEAQYAPFLKYLKNETKKPLLFNPVDGYGYKQTVNMDELDFFYMEVWPWTYETYFSLYKVITDYNTTNKGQKGISLGAYMNYEYAKKGNTYFNEAGVRYTNAVITAAGGSHMELGDRGMLSSEYYPGNHLKLTSSLKAATRNGYSFITAYEHLLRGRGWQNDFCLATVDGKAVSTTGAAGKIWGFAKANSKTGVRTLQLINLQNITSESWVDNAGNQPAPNVEKNKTVRHYVDGTVNRVLCMTPDAYDGIAIEVPFTVGKDSKGQYVEYEMPYFEYWTMSVFM